ncbi:MAG: hypothetical protein LBR65_01390 [Culturomica sp.]|jgi:hypothetical protein|nr:hypothetical protein [Culturomica sp.]
MDHKKIELAEKLRKYIHHYGIHDFTEEHLNRVGLTLNELKQHFTSREDIVRTIWEHERNCFEAIFTEYNFDGWNAIDILLIVGNEINERFFHVTPSVTMQLAEAFPVLYEQHKNLRSEFIFEKFKINIEKGMEQGIYKDDVSSEMITRMCIARLNDIHNPEIYPPEGYTFATIFNNMIDHVVKSVTNEEGKNYYKQRKQLYSVLNFR